MKHYLISKEAEMKLYEMMLSQEIRMAIQSETADRSFLTSLVGKIWISPRRNGNDGSR
jgi:hypothetical protein